MTKSNDLSTFLATYGPSFARTAYLLTGDADKARELATAALVAACRRWSTIRYQRPAEAVLRELYARFLGGAPWAAPDGFLLAGLAPRTRAAVVSTLHDGLPLPHAAAVTGLPTGALDDELRRAHLPTPSQDAGPAQDSPWTLGAPSFEQPEPELRDALVRVAAEMPYTDLGAEVLRKVVGRKRVRGAVWTVVSVGLVGTLVAVVSVGVSAVVDNVDEAMAGRTPSPFAQRTEETGYDIPSPLPAKLTDAVGYAYPGYCRDDQVNPRDPQPCGQWVLTTRSGTEWRLPDARAGYDTETGATMPLAVSQDGHRLVYQNAQGRYLVHDLPTGRIRRIDLAAADGEARIGSSPGGRYFSLSFGGADDGAVLDFTTGATSTVKGADVKILALRDDGTRVVSERRDVTDVPGHASVSMLRLTGGGARATGYRIDPALVEHGAALGPDGRSLALVTADDRLVTMDARTGRVAARRTRLDVDDLEVVKVERWLNRDEVLVRLWDYEDVYLTRVNVRTGEVVDFADDATDWIDYSDPLGALPE
ncbi:MAG: hypothetical protein HOY71_15280 [Nonomuraea sp.]|nr:hypothetical protein [Nonomuraea sp.]